MIQYYTLDEAAKQLQMPTDKLKEMAKKNQVRAFQDRGTLRFRKNEIDEMVRARGLGSDPELPLGDVSKSTGESPSSRTRRRSKIEAETVDPGSDDVIPLVDSPPASAANKTRLPSSGRRNTVTPKSAPPKSSPPKSTPPKSNPPRGPQPGGPTDSDVRLVSDDDGLDFHIELVDEAPQPPKNPTTSKAGSRKNSKLPPVMSGDSHVPLLRRDSDVKIDEPTLDADAPIGVEGLGSAESDVRLEGVPSSGNSSGRKRGEDAMVTEEIDLDAEAANIEEARRKSKMTPKSGAPVLPTTSPFELSDNDLDMGLDPKDSLLENDSSGDFELTDPDQGSVSGDEIPLLLDSDGDSDMSDEVSVGDLSGTGTGLSGINIQAPDDGGISLEGSEDEIEFDLDLDAGAASTGNTPRAKGSRDKLEGSSEFELSLPDDDGLSSAPPDSDSEFELTLDDEGTSDLDADDLESGTGSDSEFELTLDDEGSLGLDDPGAISEEDNKDIFETDFDVPALDEDGSSAGETDLEDSEFELDMEDSSTADEDSKFAIEEDDTSFGEEEDDDDQPAPTKRKTSHARQQSADLDDEEGLDLTLDGDPDDLDEEMEEEEEDEEVAVGAEAPPAPWGPVPALMLLPTVIVLIVAGLMSFEMVQTLAGYQKSTKFTGMIIDPIARMFSDSLPKE